MRQIEREMNNALKTNVGWSRGNTCVTADGIVYLHGNRIAYRDPTGTLVMDLETYRRWPTVTTRSRLRALGIPYPKPQP